MLKVAPALVYPFQGAASRVYAGAPVGGPRLFVLPLTCFPVMRNLPLPPEFGLFFSFLFFLKNHRSTMPLPITLGLKWEKKEREGNETPPEDVRK